MTKLLPAATHFVLLSSSNNCSAEPEVTSCGAGERCPSGAKRTHSKTGASKKKGDSRCDR